MILSETGVLSINSIDQSIFSMVMHFLFVKRTEFLNIIYTSFGSKGLTR
jgi:hypothetical protein